MVESLALRRQRQNFAYRLLAPLTVGALLVWLLEGHALAVLAARVSGYSALVLGIFPLELSWSAVAPRRWLLGVMLGAFVAWLAWWWGHLPAVALALMFLLLLRLAYIRQWYRREDQVETVELLRRCLLIVMWTHLSVFTALVSPY